MHLTLCIITMGDKELDKVQRGVQSIYKYVDEVQITTNHEKTDNIKKWAEAYDKIHLSHLPWDDDFSKQRNFNFSQVSDKTDYIVWMDSDDIIVNGHLLKDVAKLALKNEHDVVFFEYWYGNRFNGEPSLETFIEPEIIQQRERLIRPGSITWKKRIHETPVELDSESFSYTRVKYTEDTPIVWMHLGADRDITKEALAKRMQRNKRMLEMELLEERENNQVDPRTILYLMKIYAESDDAETLQTCVELGEEYMSKSGWDQERAVCLQLMAKCKGTLGDHEGARDLLLEAIKEYPRKPDLYLHLARAYYNLENFTAMKHWLDFVLGMDLEKDNLAINNLLELKMLSAELMLLYSHRVKRNPRESFNFAQILNELNPTPENKENVEYLGKLKDLDIASEHAHKLMDYLVAQKREDLVGDFVDAMPDNMRKLPFAQKYKNKYGEPKVWADNEICYFANFGGNHFEKWDGNSLVKGIGGSETAVIRLSEEWTKMGYKVTVYGDPENEIKINGVTYKPWYMFNHRDMFNIFISWRNARFVDKINAKKILVDLHDVYHENSYLPKIDQIDKLMLKSEFHSDYAPSIENSKKEVISNGIN